MFLTEGVSSVAASSWAWDQWGPVWSLSQLRAFSPRPWVGRAGQPALLLFVLEGEAQVNGRAKPV